MDRLTICLAVEIALFVFVDLTPDIDADLFFSSDDPQLQQSMRIDRRSAKE
jgi:hypothetical protein